MLASFYSQLGVDMANADCYEESLNYYKKAVELSIMIGKSSLIASSYYWLGVRKFDMNFTKERLKSLYEAEQNADEKLVYISHWRYVFEK